MEKERTTDVSVVVKSVEKPEVHGQCLTSEDGAVSQTTSHRSACQLFSLLGLCFLFVISSSPFYHISWPMSFIPQSCVEARAASLSKSIQQKRVFTIFANFTEIQFESTMHVV